MTDATTELLIRPLDQQPPRPGVTHVAIGVFDGVHRGHQAVIASMANRAGGILHCGVLTFEPHPLTIIRPERAPERLTTAHQRSQRLHALGVGTVVVIAFDDATRDVEANTFVDQLKRIFPQLESVTVGPRWAFGHNRHGNADFLRARALHVEELEPLRESDETISSTRIRSAIAAGDFSLAAALLGRDYEIEGTVIPGDGRGHTIGFPTANLGNIAQMLPPIGVYASRAVWADATAATVINIGRRPTVTTDENISVEAHLLDYQGELYGELLALRHFHLLRGEQKFDSIDALKTQIAKDVSHARELLAKGVL